MSKPYFTLESNVGYLGRYKVGLTGETGVLIEPARKTVIQQRADAYIEGRLGTSFPNETPPVIGEIAELHTLYQLVMCASPGNDPSGRHDRETAKGYLEMANEMIMDILRGEIALYQTDGSVDVTVSTRTGKMQEHGYEEHVFEMDQLPKDWASRDEVYGT